jgi:hypothetical protein
VIFQHGNADVEAVQADAPGDGSLISQKTQRRYPAYLPQDENDDSVKPYQGNQSARRLIAASRFWLAFRF